MDPAKVNQEVDPLRVNRTREKRFVVSQFYVVGQYYAEELSIDTTRCVFLLDDTMCRACA